MIIDVALVVAVVLTGILAGNEFGTLTVIHPALDRVSYAAGRPAAQSVIGRYGRLMPIQMPVTIAALFITAALLDGTPAALLLAAAIALVAMLLVTFAGLMPLNVKQLAATEATAESEWYRWRRRWLRLHAVRVVCDLAALVLVVIAAVLR